MCPGWAFHIILCTQIFDNIFTRFRCYFQIQQGLGVFSTVISENYSKYRDFNIEIFEKLFYIFIRYHCFCMQSYTKKL